VAESGLAAGPEEESPMRVAFLGRQGSNSEAAARQYFGPEIAEEPCPSFEAVFEAVEAGRAERAVVPVENSLAGSIHSNYDLLLQHALFITGELNLRVRHYLLAAPGVRLADLRRVTSHPQALDQCAAYLTRLGVTREAAADTATAAERVAREQRPDLAAIASLRAAEIHGLAVLAADIEDNPENYTRFLALAREPEPPLPDQPGKTSLVFALPNEPGSLAGALGVFAGRGLNLTKIESRPLRGRPWEYLFYLDFAAAAGAPEVEAALAELRAMAPFLRVLGSYPQAVG
jgi:arogenate/prephenate dehydratase